jgi:hypothetical protein
MSRYRHAATDPIVQTRLCNHCRAVIVGITDMGLIYWMDAAPCTHDVERIYHAGGRTTYNIQPRPGRTAWIDWRNPVTSTQPPTKGIVLALHRHNAPGPKTDPPAWLVTDYRVTLADPTHGQGPLF